jgi:hypothetical protein
VASAVAAAVKVTVKVPPLSTIPPDAATAAKVRSWLPCPISPAGLQGNPLRRAVRSVVSHRVVSERDRM